MVYVEADLTMKERALGKLRPPKTKSFAIGRPTNCSSSCRTFNIYAQVHHQRRRVLRR